MPHLRRELNDLGLGSRAMRWALALIAAAVLLLAWTSGAQADPALSFQSFSSGSLNADGTSSTQAAGHPYELQTSFAFGTVFDPRVNDLVPAATLKDTVVDIPAGAVGDPSVVPRCSQQDLLAPRLGSCPTETQIGYALTDVDFVFSRQIYASAIYNMEPPPGQPAQFAFIVVGAVAHIGLSVRSDGDYGVSATVNNINSSSPVFGSTIHIWGIPSDSSHDSQRFEPGSQAPGDFNGNPIPSKSPRKALLRNPTSCLGPTTTTIHAASWQEPDQVVDASSTAPSNAGCGSVPFDPEIAVAPDTRSAGSSAAFGIDLTVPQNENPAGLATSDLKKVVMTLPKGVAINSSSADGLAGCEDSAFGVSSVAEDNCPEASRIGSVAIKTPLLDDPLGGSLFLAAPLAQSPAAAADGRMYRLFLEAEGPGVWIKRIGTVVPDPVTGQLTATFDDNPQLPFETLHVQLNGGPRSPLTTPKACGTYTTHAELSPWARPSEPVGVDSNFTIDAGCANAAQFTPSLQAGTTNPAAGSPSPFALRVTSPNGQQNLSRIEATLPEGVLATLKGVTVCGDAAAASGSCPATSQVGTATVGAGAGTNPIYVPQPGRAPTAVYLAGPYKGAPYSLAVKVPAQAGPFDLGTVTVRNALYVEPTTAQVTVKSDPLPQILLGVPIAYRDVHVVVNRDNFTLNPTSCAPMEVTSSLASIDGATANPSDRFQVAGCGDLGFSPRLSLKVSGGTKRHSFPALRAELKAKEGQANIGRVAVTLPHSEFLEQAHIGTVCTRVQYAADSCPKASVYGSARAITPLLDRPLEGPVYLRSSNHPLPDLVMALHGQIDIDLAGRIDSVNGGIRTTFDAVPDAPVTKFVLNMKGGKKGLLVNSRNLCTSTNRARVLMEGQNGKNADSTPAVANSCKGSQAKKRR